MHFKGMLKENSIVVVDSSLVPRVPASLSIIRLVNICISSPHIRCCCRRVVVPKQVLFCIKIGQRVETTTTTTEILYIKVMWECHA